MADYLLLMHGDATDERAEAWPAYFDSLAAKGCLRGGSAIGAGVCVRKGAAPPPPVSAHLTGFIRIEVDSLEAALACLAGNPVYEGGGAVEVRALPQDEA